MVVCPRLANDSCGVLMEACVDVCYCEIQARARNRFKYSAVFTAKCSGRYRARCNANRLDLTSRTSIRTKCQEIRVEYWVRTNARDLTRGEYIVENDTEPPSHRLSRLPAIPSSNATTGYPVMGDLCSLSNGTRSLPSSARRPNTKPRLFIP